VDKFNTLIEIMAQLRGPGGCPWDKKQTRESLKPFLVEETYEVLEAIEESDSDMIKEELGDLLFQIVFHCQVAKELGQFDIFDVIDSISEKMITRHPHVFGDASLETETEVLVHWEKQKKREGKNKKSIIDGIPRTLPSLLRAHRLQDRVSRVGFDWVSSEEVIEKLEEEISEFKNAVAEGKKEEIEDELGDILFSLVNISRFIRVNPEDSLRKTIDKFITRFHYIEQKASEKGKTLAEMTLSEMDALWEEAKKYL
jgi:tetrapyrrole methylase family protein/MazG family protein